MTRISSRWREFVAVAQPETVVTWHRKGLRAYWGRKWGPGPGRPRIDKDLRKLIRRMAQANPLWGAPIIHGELLKLGIKAAEATVSRYIPASTGKRSSQTWKTFLDNHGRDVVAADFFGVPTASFRFRFGSRQPESLVEASPPADCRESQDPGGLVSDRPVLTRNPVARRPVADEPHSSRTRSTVLHPRHTSPPSTTGFSAAESYAAREYR